MCFLSDKFWPGQILAVCACLWVFALSNFDLIKFWLSVFLQRLVILVSNFGLSQPFPILPLIHYAKFWFSQNLAFNIGFQCWNFGCVCLSVSVCFVKFWLDQILAQCVFAQVSNSHEQLLIKSTFPYLTTGTLCQILTKSNFGIQYLC